MGANDPLCKWYNAVVRCSWCCEYTEDVCEYEFLLVFFVSLKFSPRLRGAYSIYRGCIERMYICCRSKDISWDPFVYILFEKKNK